MQNAIEVKNLKVVFPDRGRMIRAVEGVDFNGKKRGMSCAGGRKRLR